MILGLLLQMRGIDVVVLERRTRAEVLSRIRAGVLEPGVVQFLRGSGIATRLDQLGRPRNGSRIVWQDRPGLMIDVRRWTGTEMMAYGQTYLTEDLYAQADRLDTRRFEAVSDLEVTGLQDNRPQVGFRTPEGAFQLTCDFVIGCDGGRGHCAGLIPETERRVHDRIYPFGWLGIMVEAPPIDDFTYIHHAEGFALAAQRGPNLSRYYVQTPLDQGVEAWSDDRFWQAFLTRAPKDVAAAVVTGPSVEKSLAPLRSRVIEPMRWGRLFLAGDAAHLVPPTGAKGLNLAIHDVRLLSQALIAHYLDGHDDLLDRYSADALARVWAASNLSWQLTRLLHVFPGEPSFDARLRQCDYDRLLDSEDLQRALAQDYAGIGPAEQHQATCGAAPGDTGRFNTGRT
jgi:p-hydroxybenzoate 3-monooxygenase